MASCYSDNRKLVHRHTGIYWEFIRQTTCAKQASLTTFWSKKSWAGSSGSPQTNISCQRSPVSLRTGPAMLCHWLEAIKGRVTLAKTQWKIQSTTVGSWPISLPGVGSYRADSHDHHNDCATTTAIVTSVALPHQLKLGHPSVGLSGYWDETGCIPPFSATPGIVRMAMFSLSRTRNPSFPHLFYYALFIPGRWVSVLSVNFQFENNNQLLVLP